MLHVDNFAYGFVNPLLAYAASCIGCFLGLRCATRARALEGWARARWLALATTAIAVTGIWTMHFIAMLGFGITDQAITYSVPVTVLSLVIAWVVVGAGLAVVGLPRRLTPLRLVAGGLIVGVGVAAMHYVGMAAVRAPLDTLSYNPVLVGASVTVAVIAGTAALWAAMKIDRPWSALAAALIMGVAVSGMHYTGMAALHVALCGGTVPGAVVPTGGGVGVPWFVAALIVGTYCIVLFIGATVILAPSAAEMREDAARDALLAQAQERVLLSQIARDAAQDAAMTAGIRDYQKHAPPPAPTQTAAPWLTTTRVD